MGIVHKLKPEIKNWILEKKRTNPILSCRGLVSLLEDEFKIKASKSSINCLIKKAGLSMPVGRRQKKRRYTLPAIVQPQLEPTLEMPLQLPVEISILPQPEVPVETQAEPKVPIKTPAPFQPQTPIETTLLIQPEALIQIPFQISSEILQKMLSSGIILLKAADYLVGGSYYISETIKKRLSLRDKDFLAKIEWLIYAPLLETPQELFQKTCLDELQGLESIAQDILRVLSGILTEVRCIKVLLSDADTLYLDSQLHTIWSVPNIPYDFINTIHNIKNYINKSFYKDEPLVLFMAPGYDTPTTEFLNFILSLACQGKGISKLVLYGNKLEELESFPIEQNKKFSLVLGFWPWQFVEYRRVKKIGEFIPFYFQAQGKKLYLADIEIELSGSNKSQLITLFGCALKTNLSEKTRLLILSNIPKESTNSEYLANLYLNRWPNLEETFQDFSRKVELFTYTADSQRLFSSDILNLTEDAADIKQLFNRYLKLLDLYVKRHFLPSGYEDKDFSIIKEEFYNLKAVSLPQKDHILVTFQPPEGFRSLKALEYACCRLNEREITFSDGQRLWFSP